MIGIYNKFSFVLQQLTYKLTKQLLKPRNTIIFITKLTNNQFNLVNTDLTH